MNNLFVSKELALRLKNLGFKESCYEAYNTEGDGGEGSVPPEDYNLRNDVVSAPLYQQVIDWLRVNKILVSIIVHDEDNIVFEIVNNNNGEIYSSDEFSDDNFTDYYLALQSVIIKGLELVEEKNGIYKNT